MTVAEAPPRAEIFENSGELSLGRGWYKPESFAGTKFRWGRSGAEVYVVALQPVRHTLVLTIEPGPGVGLKPFDLQVYDSAQLISTLKVQGKQAAKIELPAAAPKIYRIVLRAEAGGKTLSNDPRVLDFRVFDIAIERAKPDVLPANARLGNNWHQLEEREGVPFRWVTNNAQIRIANPDGVEHLEFDVSPGPGLDNKPFTLHVRQREGGKEKNIADVQVGPSTHVDVPVPKGDDVELLLHIDAEGKKIASDPRLLNFRVYASAK